MAIGKGKSAGVVVVSGGRVGQDCSTKIRIGLHVDDEESIIHTDRVFVDEYPRFRRPRRHHIGHLDELAEFSAAEPCIATLIHASPCVHRNAAETWAGTALWYEFVRRASVN